MFKKFTQKENVSTMTQLKSSVQREVRKGVLEQYPSLEPYIDDILPKKEPMIMAKCKDHITIYLMNNTPLFFTIYDGPYMPTLRLLHKYPFMLPRMQVDRGAVKFIMSGAHIMCPGLTSEGGKMDMNVEKEKPVAIMVEGKQNALAIGWTKMSAKEIESINSGIAIDNIHYLDDGLWNTPVFE
jgi:PUA domain protein